MEKDYSGILICSDYDGTFFCGQPLDENVAAIEYFTSHGGRFTFATGRSGENILATNICFPANAPMVGMNGSEIYDLAKKTAVENYYVEDAAEIGEALRKALNANDCQYIREHAGEDVHSPNGEYPVYKVVVYYENTSGQLIHPEAIKLCGDRYELNSNGTNTLEINPRGVNKGFGALRVKELVGAKTLVCVGDWHGDISMLKAADIGYAVENAHPDVKAAADRVTVHANKSAIAKIISEL